MREEVEPIVISTLYGVEYFGPESQDRPMCECKGCGMPAAPLHSYEKLSEMKRRDTNVWRQHEGHYCCQKCHMAWLDYQRLGGWLDFKDWKEYSEDERDQFLEKEKEYIDAGYPLKDSDIPIHLKSEKYAQNQNIQRGLRIDL